MASKRKSTVPCMIPSKSKHVREEIILGAVPELLPTIPEDSILSISGESAHFAHSSSKSDMETQKGGTYRCVTCQFDSRDLNYFLDHMHNCHSDFRAQPTFYCLNCGVSVVRFEALALHNANAHPKITEGLATASLSVNKRDGVTTVEQSLFSDSGEEYKESGISLIKTPIAKMLKSKGEHKKIVVSHTVEVRKADLGRDVDPKTLTNVPELQNGALSNSGHQAMPRTTVVSNQVFHQHTPPLYSPPSCDSNKDLPKVMIPLSSIPTYDAAMDTSSFLKTSFGKFPYPTKAELCYLTVVSEFPEEQIKLWFTAQRLKQGISWSPEEIEEARRKMFNTVFQGSAPQKKPVTPQHINHIVTHHTVTAHQGSKGAKVSYGGLKPRPFGIIATQANVSTKPHVTRVSYSSPVVPTKFPSNVRATQETTAEPTMEREKLNDLEVAGSSGCASSTSNNRSSSSSSSSTSSVSSYSSSSNGVDTRKPVYIDSSPTDSLATGSMTISESVEHSAADTNGKLAAIGDGTPSASESAKSSTSQVTIDSKDMAKSTNQQESSSVVPEAAHSEKASAGNKSYLTNSSINNESPSSSCDDSIPIQNHASRSPTESTSSVVPKSGSLVADESRCSKDFPLKGMSILQQLIREEDPIIGDRGCSELRVDPLKVNFKRMNMNEAEAPSEAAQQEPKSESASFSPVWANKTPQQLQVLRQAFSTSRWPSSLQYEELSVQTGLPKPEVVRWFSDSRYSHKNGQLKWLDTYQWPPAEPDEADKEPPPAKKRLLERDANKQHEGEPGPNSGQLALWQDPYAPLLALAPAEGGGEQDTSQEAAPDPWSASGMDQQQPSVSQALTGQQADAGQSRDRLRMELLEV